jgi:cell division protein FtsW
MASRTSSHAEVGRGVARRSRTESATSTGHGWAVLALIPVGLLLVIGAGALMSASSVIALHENGDRMYLFNRHLMFIGAGVFALLVTARIPFKFYERWALPIFLLSLVALVTTLAIGKTIDGATRWVNIAGVSLQLSEFSKFASVVMLAAIFSRENKRFLRFTGVLIPALFVFGTTGVLLLAQPDFGTVLIVAGAGFAVLIASTAPLRWVGALMALGGVAGAFLAQSAPYRMQRILSFRDPLADPLGNGLQAVQSLVALGTGGLFGVGLGASRARWRFLPNAHNDFIFAIIGEEMGLVGSLAVVSLFLLFSLVGVQLALRIDDMFGRLLAIGMVAWISTQALVNIGGVAAILPISGVPLPFVSAGGSAMIANLAAVGVLMNLARSQRTES